MRLRFPLLLLFLAVNFAGFSTLDANDINSEHSLNGTWKGQIEVPGKEFPITVVFEHSTEEQKASGYLISPSHSQGKIPLSRITLAARDLRFQTELLDGSFRGKLSPGSGRIRGDWTQSGYTAELDLKLSEEGIAVDRPQNPRGTPSYEVREVTFPNRFGPHTLAGTLTIPRDLVSPPPAVVLVSGMGPHDRNGTAFGHMPLWVLADFLTNNGIAVLRFDDRGVGSSEGNYSHANTLDFATDAWAAVEFLSSLPEVNRQKIGLIGQGEGALASQITATKREDIAFLVLLGSPGATGSNTLLTQSSSIGRGIGLPDSFLTLNEQFHEALFEVLSQPVPNIERVAEIGKRYELEIKKLGELDERLWEGLEETMLYPLKRFEDPWLSWFAGCDPAEFLTKVKCPVLALTGELDLQMPASVHFPQLKEHLAESGAVFESEILSGHNHLLQRAKQGIPSEYGKIEETISPQALKRIKEWIDTVSERP